MFILTIFGGCGRQLRLEYALVRGIFVLWPGAPPFMVGYSY